MGDTGIRTFLYDNIDKSILQSEWEEWVRSLELYLSTEDIVDNTNKLLHLGGAQLQDVACNFPGAIVEYDIEEKNTFSIFFAEKQLSISAKTELNLKC